jgi:hypothetical protein
MWIVCKHLLHLVLLSLDMVQVSLYLILLLVGKELDTVLQSSQLRNKIRNSISKEHILSDNFHYFFIFYYLNFFHFIIFTFTHMYIHCLGNLPHKHLLLPFSPPFLKSYYQQQRMVFSHAHIWWYKYCWLSQIKWNIQFLGINFLMKLF